VFRISLSLTLHLRLEATPTNCTNNVVTVVIELPTSPFELSTHGIVSQLIEWISLLLLLLNAQSNKLILHRFYCVTVSDFDFILFDFLCSLDFTGLLSESQSGLVVQVTHVVLCVLCVCVLQFYHV